MSLKCRPTVARFSKAKVEGQNKDVIIFCLVFSLLIQSNHNGKLKTWIGHFTAPLGNLVVGLMQRLHLINISNNINSSKNNNNIIIVVIRLLVNFFASKCCISR